MTAGLDIRIRIWHYTYPSDDEIGGAMPTGTVSYSDMLARIHAIEPDKVFLQQGIETVRTYRCTCRPGTNLVYEQDEAEVIWPPEHRFYHQKYRVNGVSETNFHPRDSRAYLILNLTREEKSHAIQ
jgi:hypothetical protein